MKPVAPQIDRAANQRVVNRLADGGMSRVFLVTPPRAVAKHELR